MSFPGTAARTGRPAAAGLLAEQLRHTVVDLWRVRVVFVFTFLFPLTWLVVIGFLAGNATVDEDSGVRVMQFVTPTAVVMGVLYAAWPTVATALATAREQGVLKRVRGTPLPAWIYLAGRVGGAVVFALCSVLTMLIVGALAYDVQILWRTAPATVVTIAVGIACFAALGLAVAALSPSAAVAEAVSIAGAVALGFLSGLLIVGDLPGWADSIASVFPLKPFNEALQGQFDPFASGGGWDPGALAVMAAWTLAASLVRCAPSAGTPRGAAPGARPPRLLRRDGTGPSMPTRPDGPPRPGWSSARSAGPRERPRATRDGSSSPSPCRSACTPSSWPCCRTVPPPTGCRRNCPRRRAWRRGAQRSPPSSTCPRRWCGPGTVGC
ncbi:ABC-type multidrug transport system permease subunit [Rhodococcus ruber]|uniref:ABC-2 type transporter transmembrane domain-containing protein n=1 Tax=Rhodococcus ruber TaxID=1830 RepID=A0A098BND6_9NOCA|nr:ABC-type multidrug transport system permease subunit [Rhodococcus ruber]CDZ89745.1 membrane hypothetical protein [Rhodococcus ruber]